MKIIEEWKSCVKLDLDMKEEDKHEITIPAFIK